VCVCVCAALQGDIGRVCDITCARHIACASRPLETSPMNATLMFFADACAFSAWRYSGF
jgi:hypothetical protein